MFLQGPWCGTKAPHNSFWHCLLVQSRCEGLGGPWQLESHLWPCAMGRDQPQPLWTCPLWLGMRAQQHCHCLCDPRSSPWAFCHIHTHPFRGSWGRGSPSLLTQHTSNTQYSLQNPNVLYRNIKEERSRAEWPHEGNQDSSTGTRTHHSQLIISALCRRRVPRDQIISILHIHYAANGSP
jgi:hypothetical protein